MLSESFGTFYRIDKLSLRIDTELILSQTELIEKSTGLITETKTEYTASGRRERSRERGKDSKPRNFPLQTLKNLPQFRNKSHDELRQYILETKGVDIGSNFNWNGFVIAILIVIAVVIGGYGVWKWYKDRKCEN